MQYKNPAPGTDVIIINNDKICLVKRKLEPLGISFPGGFMDYEETVENTAIREAKEETSLDIKLIDILGVYSDPKRDPRQHTISITFIAETDATEFGEHDDEGEPFWISIEEAKKIDFVFDHKKIFNDFLRWKENKGSFWSSR